MLQLLYALRKSMTQSLTGSFRKGKETLKKKAEELSKLCEITVCIVIISPKGRTDIWPESPSDVKYLINEEKISSLDHVHDKPVSDGSPYYQTRLHQSTEIDFHHDQKDIDEILHLLRFKIDAIERKIRLFKQTDERGFHKLFVFEKEPPAAAAAAADGARFEILETQQQQQP